MTAASLAPQDPVLARLLATVVETMDPLEVWLFGSRAEGRARPDSDYDLLVVLPDDAPESAFDLVAAWRLSRAVRVPADILPCTRSTFDEERDELDTLARAATLRGHRVGTSARAVRRGGDRASARRLG